MKKIIIFLIYSMLIGICNEVNAQRRPVNNVPRSNIILGTQAPTCTPTFIQKFTNLAGVGTVSGQSLSKVNLFANPNGGFYVTGLRNDSTTISFFDNNDIIRWTKVFKFPIINSNTGGRQQINSMFLNSDGDLIGITDQGTYGGYLFKYNIANNNFIWIKQHMLYFPFIHSASITDCIVTGTFNSNSQIFRFDKSTGSVVNYSKNGDIGGDYYSLVVSNKVYGASRRYLNSSNDFRASLFAHDATNGNFIWQNSLISELPNPNINSNKTRMYPVPPIYDNDSLLMFAWGDIDGFGTSIDPNLEIALTKTDTFGTPKWNIQYVFPFSTRLRATAISNTSDGYFLAGNFYDTSASISNYAFGFVVKIDKNGGVIWGRRLGITNRNQINNILEINGNIYAAMSSRSYGLTDDLLLVKLDKNGNSDSCNLVSNLVVDTVQLKKIKNNLSYNTSNNNMNLVSKTTIVDSLKLVPETICIKCCKKNITIIPNKGNSKYCFGDSICFSTKVNDSLNLIGGYKYQWYQKNISGTWVITSNLDTIPNPCFYYSTIGTFTYRVIVTTNSAKCQDTTTINVTVNSKPNANAGPDKSICPSIFTQIGSSPISGNTYSWSSNQSGFTSTVASPSVNPSIPTTYYLTVTNTATQCVAKDTVVVSINSKCNPPTCTPCTTKVSATSTISLTNATNIAASQLTQSFSFAGIPANITEVRATVTNIKLFAVDENGNIKEDCLSCKNDPRTWASLINGSGINGITPKIYINGIETNAPVTLAADINTRNISWKNGSQFLVNNQMQLSFLLPQKSTLPCCTRKATICVKFVFRNDKCEDCELLKCFDIEIK